MTSGEVLGEVTSSVSAPVSFRYCNEVSPSPCVVAFTCFEFVSKLFLTTHPTLRCGSTPSPINLTSALRIKSPWMVVHRYWKSSFPNHMLVPEPLRIYVWSALEYSAEPFSLQLPMSKLLSKIPIWFWAVPIVVPRRTIKHPIKMRFEFFICPIVLVKVFFCKFDKRRPIRGRGMPFGMLSKCDIARDQGRFDQRKFSGAYSLFAK